MDRKRRRPIVEESESQEPEFDGSLDEDDFDDDEVPPSKKSRRDIFSSSASTAMVSDALDQWAGGNALPSAAETLSALSSSAFFPPSSLPVLPVVSTQTISLAFPAGTLDSFNSQLANQFYVNALRRIENELKYVRAFFNERNMDQVSASLLKIRSEVNQIESELRILKEEYYLSSSNFQHLLKNEEFIQNTLLPQLILYEGDYRALSSGKSLAEMEPAVLLHITAQETAGPIFKERRLGHMTVRLFTGANVMQIHSGYVNPFVVCSSARVKKNNEDIEKVKLPFQENASALFPDLKFSSGTFPALASIRFRVSISTDGKVSTIESPPSKPFVSMTNTGSQWKEAAGSWLREDCFKGAEKITMPRFWNYFQAHLLLATKQEPSALKRPFLLEEFNYLIKSKFLVNYKEKSHITLDEFNTFWDWIGPALKRLRYQKHLLWMFESGYLPAFINREESVAKLENEPPGTFLLRISERNSGEFVISYSSGGGNVRHYLIQPDDTADKKKTLVDFLGKIKILTHILQLTFTPDGRSWQRHTKDQVLNRFYKKSSKKASLTPSSDNPYDNHFPSVLDD